MENLDRACALQAVFTKWMQYIAAQRTFIYYSETQNNARKNYLYTQQFQEHAGIFNMLYLVIEPNECIKF